MPGNGYCSWGGGRGMVSYGDEKVAGPPRPPGEEEHRICSIRAWAPEDAADLAAAISNPNVQKYLRDGLPYPYTEQDAREFIAAMRSAGEAEDFAFAIAADGKAVGSISLSRGSNRKRQTAELGYYLAEPYWGRGLATEAVRQICRYAFDHSDILRIYAEVFESNAASCRVLEKAGFKLEGRLRCGVVKSDRALNTKLYAPVREAPLAPSVRIEP